MLAEKGIFVVSITLNRENPFLELDLLPIRPTQASRVLAYVPPDTRAWHIWLHAEQEKPNRSGIPTTGTELW